MPKFMANEDDKLVILSAAPTNKDALTSAQATNIANEDLSMNVRAAPQLRPNGSAKVSMPAMGEDYGSETLGKSSYVGELEVFRYYDEITKQPDATEDLAFQALTPKGTELHLVRRTGGKPASAPLATGDEYSYFKAVTDDPQLVEELEGWRRYKIPLAISDASICKLIVAGA